MVSPLPFAASGDPAHDRRLDWARAYSEAGEPDVAIPMLEDLVAEAPHFSAAWFLLGELREAAGDGAGAVAAFERVVAGAPDDPLGAGLHLARLGARPLEGAMSPAYVRTLFDQFAERFDAALRERLNYRGPELLAGALQTTCRETGRPLRFARTLDLGCGTGLAAPMLALMADQLEGVDLSPAMLSIAMQLGLYARLHEGDLSTVLAQMEPEAFDLILAADAFCYVAALGPVLALTAAALAPGGLLACTLETHEGEGVILRDTLRYAHGSAHISEAAAASGLYLLHLEAVSARTEKGVPVPGLVAVFARSAPSEMTLLDIALEAAPHDAQPTDTVSVGPAPLTPPEG